MNDKTENRPVPLWVSLIFAAGLACFLWLQVPVLFGEDGILARHGFWGGFDAFNRIMLSDPVTVAGLIDLSTLAIVFIVILANGIPRGPNYWWQLIVAVVVFIVYPGLTALVFMMLHWRRFGQFRP